MSAGILCGYEKKFALRYSFIMSIPAVLGACVLEISDAQGQEFNPIYLLGMLVAAVVGYGAIKLMLNIVKNKKYVIFSIYCFIMGIVAIVGSFIKK